MDPNAPSTMFGAWVLAPAILALSAIGWGALVELATGRRLDGLRYPLGLCAMAAVTSSLIVIGASAKTAVAICAVGAFIGLVVFFITVRQDGLDPRRPAGRVWPAITGIAAFGFLMLPLIGSGRAGVLGYVFNNDPAAHLTAIELLKTSGTHYFEQTISTTQAVSALFEGSYPLGSHSLVLYGNMLSGTEAVYLWTPTLAMCAVAGALAIRWMLAQFAFPQWACALGGVAAAGSYLPLSYLAQGGLKEVLMASIAMAAAACAEYARREEFVARSLIPFCVAGAGALAVMGAAGAAWILPIGAVMLALALANPREDTSRGRIAGGFAIVGGVTLLLMLPQVLDAINFTQIQSSGGAISELGNLYRALKWYATLGAWFSPDYRVEPTHQSLNAFVLLIALIAFTGGLVTALRRKHIGIPVAVGSALLATIWLHFSYSPYFEAKGLVVLAMAVAAAIVVGLVAITGMLRRTGIVLTLIVLLGVGWSWLQVYQGVWITPKDRFTELALFNQKLAGKGPVLVNDREAYVKVLMSDSDPNEIWSDWIPTDPIITTSGYFDLPPHTPDTDDYDDAFTKRFPWILDRKHPGSRPPGNYALVQDSAHYRLWKRTGPPPKDHIAMGVGKVGNAEKLRCARKPARELIAKHPNAKVRVALAPQTLTRPLAAPNQIPPGFFPSPQPGGYFIRAADNAASAGMVTLKTGERYDVFLQGSLVAGFANYQDGNPTGEARQDLGTRDGWQQVGSFVATGDSTSLLVAMTKPSWQAGSKLGDLVSQTAYVPASGDRVVVTTGRGLKKYCGENVDWLELL